METAAIQIVHTVDIKNYEFLLRKIRLNLTNKVSLRVARYKFRLTIEFCVKDLKEVEILDSSRYTCDGFVTITTPVG